MQRGLKWLLFLATSAVVTLVMTKAEPVPVESYYTTKGYETPTPAYNQYDQKPVYKPEPSYDKSPVYPPVYQKPVYTTPPPYHPPEYPKEVYTTYTTPGYYTTTPEPSYGRIAVYKRSPVHQPASSWKDRWDNAWQQPVHRPADQWQQPVHRPVEQWSQPVHRPVDQWQRQENIQHRPQEHSQPMLHREGDHVRVYRSADPEPVHDAERHQQQWSGQRQEHVNQWGQSDRVDHAVHESQRVPVQTHWASPQHQEWRPQPARQWSRPNTWEYSRRVRSPVYGSAPEQMHRAPQSSWQPMHRPENTWQSPAVHEAWRPQPQRQSPVQVHNIEVQRPSHPDHDNQWQHHQSGVNWVPGGSRLHKRSPVHDHEDKDWDDKYEHKKHDCDKHKYDRDCEEHKKHPRETQEHTTEHQSSTTHSTPTTHAYQPYQTTTARHEPRMMQEPTSTPSTTSTMPPTTAAPGQHSQL